MALAWLWTAFRLPDYPWLPLIDDIGAVARSGQPFMWFRSFAGGPLATVGLIVVLKRGFMMTTGRFRQAAFSAAALVAAIALMGVSNARAQELGGAGTVQGTIKDPTGAPMAAVTVDLSNPVTGLKRSTTSDANGRFTFRNLPPNPYHVSATAQGFAPHETDVDVRSAIPIDLSIALKVA